eukprot:TRINITY_DN23081_c0_g1_i1.p1 TRINITY_DN23081_c0_g1~~TRINITY_DN23081_c0_g1_i1.p1  ORF type:complete len:165 (+),score=35.92 TRINITY_DN23081_c0_g1_i1:90-584(+)
MAMCNVDNILLMETIKKEKRIMDAHLGASSAPATYRAGGKSAAELQQTPRKRPVTVSAAMRFLEEKVGLAELDSANVEDGRPPTRQALYRGVSHDGQGRAEYLRLRKKYGVLERYDTPQTVTHDYGVGTDKVLYTASVNCKKPIIQSSFYRPMGVQTHKDMPTA